MGVLTGQTNGPQGSPGRTVGRSDASSSDAEVGRGSQHAAIVGPDFLFARLTGCCEVKGIAGSQEDVRWRGRHQRPGQTQQGLGDRHELPNTLVHVLQKHLCQPLAAGWRDQAFAEMAMEDALNLAEGPDGCQSGPSLTYKRSYLWRVRLIDIHLRDVRRIEIHRVSDLPRETSRYPTSPAACWPKIP